MRQIKLIIATLVLISPMAANADPIVLQTPGQEPYVVGWENSHGTFHAEAFDIAEQVIGAADPGLASYDGLVYTFSATTIAFDYFANITVADAVVNVAAIVQGDGTTTGNLIGGVLEIYSSGTGIPSRGIGPNELLFSGIAVDSAAIADATFATAFLFEVTSSEPALSYLGDYVTFWGPQGPVWNDHCCGPPTAYRPWDLTFENESGGISYVISRTIQVPEPGTLALLGIGLFGMGLARRRQAV